MLKSKPEKAITSLDKHLKMLEAGETEKAKPKLTNDIQTIHKMLYGDSDNEPQKKEIDYIVPNLCSSETDLFKKLGENLKSYDFESKKKTAEIMNYIVRRTGKDDNPFADYLRKNKSIVTDLLKGYHDPNLSQNVGSVLQEMCKRSELAKLLLNEMKIKVHDYNDWDAVVKAQEEAKGLSQDGQDATQQDEQENKDNKDNKGDNGDNGDDSNERGGLPDWTREQTAENLNDDGDDGDDNNNDDGANQGGGDDAAAAQGAQGAQGGAVAAAAADEKKEEKNDEAVKYNDMVDELFILVQNPSFDIASDAYKTLQLLLTRHKKEVSRYLDSHYRVFFDKFNYLIMSENYVTKRQFLKLLSELLLDKHNFKTMLKYISEKDNLINSMKLIKNNSKAIAFEAFHIFKVFVANPNKSRDVHIVLYKNQAKLIQFLSNFLKEKEDQSFISEKEIVIQHLTNMEMPKEIREKLEERQKQQELENANNENSNNADNGDNGNNGDNANNDGSNANDESNAA